jgi:glycine/D-amino acid oxidase-like deaminating enzyme
MPQVVIVGAGVIGASIAWHLSELGCGDVLVLDRAPGLGGGSTPLATGGFRAQFATEVNVRLSMLSREKLRRFPEEIGVDSGYRPYGYLFLAASEATMNVLRDAQRVQHACGLTEARMVTAVEARAINPAIGDGAIAGGAYCPTDGFIRAMQILRGYHDAAVRRGVRFELGVEVVGVHADGDRVVALRTTRGDVAAEHFVNAAGAWAATFGFDVPVTPLRRRVAPTIVTDVLPDTMPMTIWTDDGYHIRVRDGRVLLLWPDPAPPGFDDLSVGEEWLATVRAFTDARVPSLRGVPIDRAQCWAGLYEMSPDKHSIVGRAPGLANAWLANGSSGHGVMHGPAIGQIVAEMITGAPMAIDVLALRPERFAEGTATAGASLL